MIRIAREDLVSLEAFRLRWRWTQPKWNVLPPRVLQHIHALSPEKTREVWNHLHPIWEELYPLYFVPSNALPTRATKSCGHIQRIDAVGDANLPRAAIEHLDPHPREAIVVLWEPTLAVVTRWQMFCAYWEDFCYPGSDDVCISSWDETWLLCYSHDEVFLFGKRGNSANP